MSARTFRHPTRRLTERTSDLMTPPTKLHPIPRTVDSDPRDLPGPSDVDRWTAEFVASIAEPEACDSPEQLIATYGTDDPDLLRATFALADDVEAAERFAARGRQVAA